MTDSRDATLEIQNDPHYPRSSTYDFGWIRENWMGAHPLWLQEALLGDLALSADARVLDLGCGKAAGSIFLARETGAQIWATDLWIGATENLERIRAAGLDRQVFPIHADARELPFADGFFDALSSINSLFFYVTDEVFLREAILRCVRPGGIIAAIVPGFHRAYTGGIPEALKPHWSGELDGWRTADWWRDLFERTGVVNVLRADTMGEEGTRLYHQSARLAGAAEAPFNVLAGDNITFIRIAAKKR